MRDLFGSTKYIKFGVLETILSSSNAVNDLLELEEQKKLEGDFSFLDYLANLDSYLYGLIKLPSNDTKNLEIWINNYIKYLYIPLIEKDCIYLVKSRLIGELSKVKNKDSEIGDNLKDICLETLDFILATVEYKKEELEHILNALTKAQNTLFSNSTVTLEGEIDEAKILIMDTNSQSVNNTYGSHHEYYILVYNGEKNKYTASYIDILNSNAMVTIANNYSYGSYRDLKNASLIEFGLNENVSISAVKPLNTFFDELDLKDYIKAEYTLEELQDIINHINELKLQSIEKEERSYDAIIEPKIYVLSLKGDLNGQYSEDFSKYQFLSFNVKSTVVADKYVEIYSYDDLINHGAVVETFSNGFGNYTDKSKGVSFTFTFGDKASKILSIEDFLNNEGLSDLIKKSYTKRDLIEISNLLQDNLTRQRGN